MEFKKHLPEDYSENFKNTLDTHFSLFSVSTLGVVLPVRNKHFFSLPDIYGSTIGIQLRGQSQDKETTLIPLLEAAELCPGQCRGAQGNLLPTPCNRGPCAFLGREW